MVIFHSYVSLPEGIRKKKTIYTNGPSLPSRIREHQGVQPQRREVLQSFPPLAPAMAAVSPRPWISTGATHATRDHYQSYSNYIELSLIVPYIITIIMLSCWEHVSWRFEATCSWRA